MDARQPHVPKHDPKYKPHHRQSFSGHPLLQQSEDGLVSFRYQPIKQRPRSFTVSSLITSENSSVPYTIVEQDELTPPCIEFDMKQLDKALQTAFVLLSSCDRTLGHLPDKLKQSIVQKAQEDSTVMSNHVKSQRGNGKAQLGIGSAQSIIHRLYSNSPAVEDQTSAEGDATHSLSTGDLQQAIKNGATQVQTYDKRLSSGSDVTDSSESCSSVTSEPSTPRTPYYNHAFSIAVESGSLLDSSRIIHQGSPTSKDKLDVWALPFTKAYTSSKPPSLTRSRSSQADSDVFTKRSTGLGLADLVHSVLGDAIKQADIELRWDESGDWESEDEEEPAMTEQEIRDYELERSLAMRKNPINRYLSDGVNVLY
ncbi:hypothetical protein K450DRAFT_245791 [Umbelopsis ramanniana AG]|uniref:Uncharacterized protein n=1 Tax=Umbelopsis ramanniana AG TaxID=1314678 RepID=A0AAD5E749_UMBRA|nr:uncharacterized protein K450DRAFT_245791 [Umbelopsis ramanniana AG]KAI8578631.1 hypothetical protein K450DRAFT_245791 [Umbelopsis ramanniana AG]